MQLQDKLIGALIGLSRATENTLPTEQTFAAINRGLASLEHPTEELVQEIREVKYALVPDCRICKNPCGHNDDYDMALWHGAEREVQKQKEEILTDLCRLSNLEANPARRDLLLRGLFMLGYGEDLQMLQPIAEELHKAL